MFRENVRKRKVGTKREELEQTINFNRQRRRRISYETFPKQTVCTPPFGYSSPQPPHLLLPILFSLPFSSCSLTVSILLVLLLVLLVFLLVSSHSDRSLATTTPTPKHFKASNEQKRPTWFASRVRTKFFSFSSSFPSPLHPADCRLPEGHPFPAHDEASRRVECTS